MFFDELEFPGYWAAYKHGICPALTAFVGAGFFPGYWAAYKHGILAVIAPDPARYAASPAIGVPGLALLVNAILLILLGMLLPRLLGCLQAWN